MGHVTASHDSVESFVPSWRTSWPLWRTLSYAHQSSAREIYVFMSGATWWTVIRSSGHLLGDLQRVGVCGRERVSSALQERPWRGAEVEPERDCLATTDSPNVSLTKKAWMSYGESGAHTHTRTRSPSQSFNLLNRRTHKLMYTQALGWEKRVKTLKLWELRML